MLVCLYSFSYGCSVHGSAPDIAGKNIANPIASIRYVSLPVPAACQLMPKSPFVGPQL